MLNAEKGYSAHSSRDGVAKFLSRAAAAILEGDDARDDKMPGSASGWLPESSAAS